MHMCINSLPKSFLFSIQSMTIKPLTRQSKKKRKKKVGECFSVAYWRMLICSKPFVDYFSDLNRRGADLTISTDWISLKGTTIH